jgi:hypothetical protein
MDEEGRRSSNSMDEEGRRSNNSMDEEGRRSSNSMDEEGRRSRGALQAINRVYQGIRSNTRLYYAIQCCQSSHFSAEFSINFPKKRDRQF